MHQFEEAAHDSAGNTFMSLTHSAGMSSGGLVLIFPQMGGSANAHGKGRPFFVGFCGADVGKADVFPLEEST